MTMTNTKIWATFEDGFDIQCRVVKWDEENGFNFIPQGRYTKRDIKLEALRKEIKQFTVHWSVTYRASHMFNGLKARRLSCNFMIDDDSDDKGFATIYQCLPIMYGGWSQGGGCNGLGPGVEISYMPQAWEKDMYTEASKKRWKVPEHKTVTAPIHGTKLKVHLPTEAQINSLLQLMWGFSELFPNVPTAFPRDDDGNLVTTNLKSPKTYTGFLNHYHIKRGKIDTAGLDMKMIEEEVQERKELGF